jgi:ornithine cyclodeaminase/alanine dehydrogenase-like protein (mu-crystallin family)
MADALSAMRDAFVELSAHRAAVPPRVHLDVPGEDGMTLVMWCHPGAAWV